MWQLLIYLIILSNIVTTLTQSSSTCPENCTCRNFPCKTLDSFCFKTTVRCNILNGSLNLPNTTDHLEIFGVSGKTLCETFGNLGELTLLESLTIKASDVSNISKCFQYLTTNIKDLKLQQNNLTAFPQLFASDNSSLRTLDFSENLIEFVGKIKFSRTIETLNLSGNSISKIKSNSLNSLKSLKILDLSRNNLSMLNKELFQHLTTLKLLNLSYNNIKTLQQEYFSDLSSLEQLDLSFNKLIKVNLESLNLPNLISLYLTGNKQVGKLNNLLVGESKKLKFVDASNSEIEKIPGVLTQSIKTLKLAKNNIRSINCGELDAYPLLQLLDLSSNKINFVEEDSFGRLEFLTVLYLEDNKLKNIPKSLPEQMIILHLQSNMISALNKDDFEGLFHLEVLNLRKNNITFIEDQGLSNLTSLATIDLSENRISIIGLNSLYGPLSLQTLRLSAVGTILPAKDVSFPLLSPENLVILDLSHSAGLARQMLNDEAFLDAAKQLQELNLDDNGLESLRSDLFHFLPQLRILSIQNNRFNCSGLEWLASWMRRQDYPEYSSIICSNPTHLQGLPLIDLQYVEPPPIKAVNQGYKPINQVRKSGTTTTYQVGQYYGEQKTSYKIKIGAKSGYYDGNIDSVREAKTPREETGDVQVKSQCFSEKRNEFKKQNGANIDLKRQIKLKQNLSLVTTKNSTEHQQSGLNLITRPNSSFIKRGDMLHSLTSPILPSLVNKETERTESEQLPINFKNNKTHLSSDIAISRNNIISPQHTQNAALDRKTKSLNNTNAMPVTKYEFTNTKLASKMTISGALSVKPTSNENYPANVPSRSRNQSQNGYINNLNPLSDKTEGENNLNQDKDGNNFGVETLRSKNNLIFTYESTDINKSNNKLLQGDYSSQKTIYTPRNVSSNLSQNNNKSLENKILTKLNFTEKISRTLTKSLVLKQVNLTYKAEPSQPNFVKMLRESKKKPKSRSDAEKILQKGQLLNERDLQLKKKLQNSETTPSPLSDYSEKPLDQPKISMYTKENTNQMFFHPGMIILIVGVLSGVLTLIFLAAKLKRERRTSDSALCSEDNENIEVSEVSTLPNVTELW